MQWHYMPGQGLSAPSFVVFACLQDPRKEVIPSRGLITQMIGLRLKDVSETTMVLGETAVSSGAHCHRIQRSVPGTGYVIPEEGGYPIRVRAGFASDHAIRQVAKTFATPFHENVPALEVRDELLLRGLPGRARVLCLRPERAHRERLLGRRSSHPEHSR